MNPRRLVAWIFTLIIWVSLCQNVEGQIYSISVTGTTYTVNAIASYSFQMTFTTLPKAGDYVEVEFPSGYSFPSFGGTASSQSGTDFGTSSCTIIGQTIKCQVNVDNTMAWAQFTLDGVKNSGTPGPAGTFLFRRRNFANILQESGPKTATFSLTIPAISSVAISATPLQMSTSITVAFSIALPAGVTAFAGDRVRLNFPGELGVSGVAGSTPINNVGFTPTAASMQVAGQEVSFSFAVATTGTISFHIAGVQSPGYSGSISAWSYIRLTDAGGGTIKAEAINAGSMINFPPQPIDTTIQILNPVTGMLSTYTINFVPTTALKSNDRIRVTFPTGIDPAIADAQMPVFPNFAVGGNFKVTGNIVDITSGQVLPSGTPLSFGIPSVKNEREAAAYGPGDFIFETWSSSVRVRDQNNTVVPVNSLQAPTTLSATIVGPTSNVIGAQTDWTFIISSTSMAFLVNDQIHVTFPPEFDVSASSGTALTGVAGWTQAGLCQVTGNRVEATLDGGVPASSLMQFTIPNIRNPGTPGTVPDFPAISVAGPKKGAIESALDVTSTASLVAPPVLGPGTQYVGPLPCNTTRCQAAWGTFVFDLPGPMAVSEQLVVRFPPGVDVSACHGTSAMAVGFSVGIGTVTVSGQSVLVPISAPTMGTVSFVLPSVRNPDYAGPITFEYFRVRETTGTPKWQSNDIPGPTIVPGLVSSTHIIGNISALAGAGNDTTIVAGMNADWAIHLQLDVPLAVGDIIRLFSWPTSWDLATLNGQSLQWTTYPLQVAPNSIVVTTLSMEFPVTAQVPANTLFSFGVRVPTGSKLGPLSWNSVKFETVKGGTTSIHQYGTVPVTTPMIVIPSCGNGLTESENGEQCDDGNSVVGDGCGTTCQLETVPALVITPGSPAIVDEGTTKTFKVRLSGPPSPLDDPLEVGYSLGNDPGSRLSVSSSAPTFVFTAANYSVPRVITVAVTDTPNLESALYTSSLAVAPTVTGTQTPAASVAISVRDSEYTLTSSPCCSFAVSDDGTQSQSYVVSLSAPPTGQVTITLSASDPEKLVISPSDPIVLSGTGLSATVTVRAASSHPVAVPAAFVYTISSSVTTTDARLTATNGALIPDYRVTVFNVQEESPVILFVTPDTGPVDGGTLVTITGRRVGLAATSVGVTVAGISAEVKTHKVLNADVTPPVYELTVLTGPATAPISGPIVLTTQPFGLGSTVSDTSSITFAYTAAASGTNTTGSSSTGEDISFEPSFLYQNSTGVLTIDTRTGVQFPSSLALVTSITAAGLPCGEPRTLVSSTRLTCTLTTRDALTSGPVQVVTASASLSSGAIPFQVLSRNVSAPQPMITDIQPTQISDLNKMTVLTVRGIYLGQNLRDVVRVTVADIVPCTPVTKVSPTGDAIECQLFGDAALAELQSSFGIGLSLVGTNGTVVIETLGSSPARSSQIVSFVYGGPSVLDSRPKIIDPAGGTIVSIMGEHFTPPGFSPTNLVAASRAIAANLGGVACTPTYVSDTLIQCPSLAASVYENLSSDQKLPVSVTIGGLTSQAAGVTFAYGSECNPPCGWRGQCTNPPEGATCVCDPGYFGPPGCEVTAFERVVSGTPALRTSEDGKSRQEVSIRLTRAPQRDVVVRATSSDTSEGAVGPNPSVTFTASNWNTAQVFTITGVSDQDHDGDQFYTVFFDVASQDPVYGSREVSNELSPLHLKNLDRPPLIAEFGPKICPLLGCNVTLIGENFASRVVAVLDQERTFLPWTERFNLVSATATGDRRLSVREAHELRKQRAVVEMPQRSSEGYHILRIINPYGAAANATVFYTNDCPEEGMYGLGRECSPCPEGAICPGGYRIIAKRGYWNRGEGSGFVARCDPPERCLGQAGPNGEVLCAPSYTGELCSECVVDHFKTVTGECLPCPGAEDTLPFIIADIAVWSFVGLAFILVRDQMGLSYLILTVRVIQLIGGLGSLGKSSALPGFMKDVYSVVHLFSGDWDFLKPDCFNPVPYQSKFLFKLAYSVAIFIPTWVFLLIAICVQYMCCATVALTVIPVSTGGGKGIGDSYMVSDFRDSEDDGGGSAIDLQNVEDGRWGSDDGRASRSNDEAPSHSYSKHKADSDDHSDSAHQSIDHDVADINDNGEITLEEAQARDNFYLDRFCRSLIIWPAVVYLTLTATAIDTLSCFRLNGVYVMITQPSVLCYGENLLSTLLSVVILIVLTVGFPLGGVLYLRRNARMMFRPRFAERFSYLYEFYRPGFTAFWSIEFLIATIVAASNSALVPHPKYQFSLCLLTFLGKFVFVLWKKPFLDRVSDIMHMAMAIAYLVALNASLLASLTDRDMDSVSEPLGITLLIIFIGCIIGALILAVQRCWKHPGTMQGHIEQHMMYFGESFALKPLPSSTKLDRDSFGSRSHSDDAFLADIQIDDDRGDKVRAYQQLLVRTPAFGQLSRQDHLDIAHTMVSRHIPPNGFLVTEGARADEMFIVIDGSLGERPRTGHGKMYRAGDVIALDTLKSGAGEYKVDIQASKDSSSAAHVAVIDGHTFDDYIRPSLVTAALMASDDNNTDGQLTTVVIEEFKSFLDKISLLEPLSDEERCEIARNMTPVTYYEDEYIVTQGDVGDCLFLIQDGQVRVNSVDSSQSRSKRRKGKDIAVLEKGDYFGEMALLNDQRRNASCVAASDVVHCGSIDRDTFERLFGPLKDLLETRITRRERYEGLVTTLRAGFSWIPGLNADSQSGTDSEASYSDYDA